MADESSCTFTYNGNQEYKYGIKHSDKSRTASIFISCDADRIPHVVRIWNGVICLDRVEAYYSVTSDKATALTVLVNGKRLIYINNQDSERVQYLQDGIDHVCTSAINANRLHRPITDYIALSVPKIHDK